MRRLEAGADELALTVRDRAATAIVAAIVEDEIATREEFARQLESCTTNARGSERCRRAEAREPESANVARADVSHT